MKTKQTKTNLFSFTAAGLLAIASLFLSTSQTNAQQTQPAYNISGNAGSAQVVPAVPGTAMGAGTLTGTYNPTTRELNYTSTWNNLTGAPKMAGLYVGASGAQGKILGEPWPLGTNNKPNGNITGKVTLTEEQAKDLLDGNLYYLYGTDTNATGEIRGQIKAEKP